MATRVSLANVARVSAGVVAVIWSLLGLGSALAAFAGHDLDAIAAIAIAVNAALLASAVLAFTGTRNWRAVMIGSMIAVTVERIVYVLNSQDYWLALSSVLMLAALTGIALAARAR